MRESTFLRMLADTGVVVLGGQLRAQEQLFDRRRVDGLLTGETTCVLRPTVASMGAALHLGIAARGGVSDEQTKLRKIS